MKNKTTDDEIELIRCPVCEAVNIDNGGELYCHRCNSRIYRDPKYGISRTWALLITAMILYIPANFFPVLQVHTVFSNSQNTIVGGMISLWDEGSYAVALVILVASVFVPILKFILLIYLLLSVKHPVSESPETRYKLYYLTEVIGPWSMVDVFVVSVLTGLVRYSSFSIVAGTGATAFVLMVFFTMLAALSFDTRYIRQSRLKPKIKESDREPS
jgi:paraquat-inducible protein A